MVHWSLGIKALAPQNHSSIESAVRKNCYWQIIVEDDDDPKRTLMHSPVDLIEATIYNRVISYDAINYSEFEIKKLGWQKTIFPARMSDQLEKLEKIIAEVPKSFPTAVTLTVTYCPDGSNPSQEMTHTWHMPIHGMPDKSRLDSVFPHLCRGVVIGEPENIHQEMENFLKKYQELVDKGSSQPEVAAGHKSEPVQ